MPKWIPDPSNRPACMLWSISFFAALLFHLFLLLIVNALHQRDTTNPIPDHPLHQVDLLSRAAGHYLEQPSPKAEPPKELDETKPIEPDISRKKPRTKRTRKKSKSLDVPEKAHKISELSKQTITQEENKSKKFNPQISTKILDDIVKNDARMRRKRHRPSRGPFDNHKLPSKSNLPADLKFDEIRRLMEQRWKPDFSQIKDDSIAKISPGWIKSGLGQWFQKYRKELQALGRQDGPTKDLELSDIPLPFSNYSTNRVSVELELEPLKDGTFAVTIAKSSGHPFFDTQTLAEVKKVAALFPPWKEGYGHALRYRLDADFIIIPPTISNLFGLSCAFPFCTPEEYKKLEIYHWFKKLIKKHVHFEGLIKPPPDEPVDKPDTDD